MRENRSEFIANEAQARTVIETIAETLHTEATRRDWRAVLADRDDGRTESHARRETAARNRRMTRRTHVRNAGRVTLPTLATMGTLAAAVVGAVGRVLASVL